ncbi:MAG TPA: ATP-binding cassette domain-containing protein [Pyrinomonadaceae bacterium]|nr:ATP-binding cassette domain-containing protein [Pyrinomonadaceae bacterium]
MNGSRWVLRNIDLSVSGGSVLGVLGRKGAGKTTLLRVIAGLEKPNGGTVNTGREPNATNAADGIAYVPTMPASQFWQRAFGKTAGTVDAAGRQTEAIDTTLRGNDTVLLLDDAFLFYDRESKLAKMAEVRRIARERSIAVVYAANSFNDILEFCDDAVIIDNTEVTQTGSPQELYENPVSTAVAALTGRCNFIEARRLSSSKTLLPEFQAIAGDYQFFARKAELAAMGAINRNVMLAIRPEHISISFGASFPEDNLLKATIAGVRFLGPMTLVTLDAEGLTLEALVMRLVGLNIGDECMVGLPPDRIMILKH